MLLYTSVRMNIRIYSNIRKFSSKYWYSYLIRGNFQKPNIIRIFEHFCTNISEYWSLKITWNTWIKEFYFSFLTWRYILTILLITMIISCWFVNPLNTGHLCKVEFWCYFGKIFIFALQIIRKYSNIRIFWTIRILFEYILQHE